MKKLLPFLFLLLATRLDAACVIVQECADTWADSGTTASCSLPSVTAGNSIVALSSTFGHVPPTISVDDGTGYSLAVRSTSPTDEVTASIHYRHNVSAASYTVTFTTNATAGNRYGHARAVEVSGLTNAVPNQTVTNSGTSTTPTSGNSTATTQTACVIAALAVGGGSSNIGIDAPATTGYTNLQVEQSPLTEMGASFDYKSGIGTGVQSAAWGTLSASIGWSASLAAFQESGGAASGLLLRRRRN